LLEALLLLEQRILINKTAKEFFLNYSLCILLGAHSVSETLIFVHKVIQEELIVKGEDAVCAEVATGLILDTSCHHKAVHAFLLIGKSSLTVIP
jgi:hypothetical protein